MYRLRAAARASSPRSAPNTASSCPSAAAVSACCAASLRRIRCAGSLPPNSRYSRPPITGSCRIRMIQPILKPETSSWYRICSTISRLRSVNAAFSHTE